MNKDVLLALVSCFFIGSAFCQSEPDTMQAKSEFDEVILSSSKFGERNNRVAAKVAISQQKDFSRLNSSTMANLLESSSQVFVQKSQQGGGSPVIRGLEANRILLMVDGVRMNNAIYRGGHLQNIITVDPNAVDRFEVVFGPSSTLFGSDALGGVINMFTKDPKLSGGSKPQYHYNQLMRYSSAFGEKMFHGDFNAGGKKWASFSSVTYSSFGDLKVGKNENSQYPEFGLKPFVVKRINGKDSVTRNEHPTVISPSKYHQFDIVQKVLYKPSPGVSHLLNLQASHSSDIPRADRLSEVINNLPRFAEWYYGPQKRYMASYRYEKVANQSFFQELRVVASHQYVEESRFDRRLNQPVRNERTEKVNVSAYSIDARRKMSLHELSVGMEGQLNNLQSVARGINVDNQSISAITTRYPDGDNQMYFAAVYAQHLYKISKYLTLNDGVRLTYTHLNSTFEDKSITRFPFSRANQQHLAVNGNAGLVYAKNNNLKVATLFSSGFRAPNFDDLSKVFDSKSGAVVVPNSSLKPEYSYNIECNATKYFPIHQDPIAFSLSGSVFHNWISNAIVVDKFNWQGQDSIDYNGVKSMVLASQNKATARIWGWSASTNWHITRHIFFDGMITYTKGTYLQNNVEVPMDHIAPLFGKAALRFNDPTLDIELSMMFNGWKRLADYSPAGEDNLQYATPDGMPSWKTFNTRVQYKASKLCILQLAVENLLDSRYRTFSSGISAAGRNIILSLKTML